MKTVLLIDIVAAVVVNSAAFSGDAQVSQNGSVVQTSSGNVPAAEGCRWFDGPGLIGWAWDGKKPVEPAAPAPTLPTLLAYAADRRWRREVGGITIGSVPIATDDRAKIMIMCARVAAQANPDWTTVWHGADGKTYPLSATAIIAISDAVEAHVNAGFTAFAAAKTAIESGEITTTSEIDAVFGL